MSFSAKIKVDAGGKVVDVKSLKATAAIGGGVTGKEGNIKTSVFWTLALSSEATFFDHTYKVTHWNSKGGDVFIDSMLQFF